MKPTFASTADQIDQTLSFKEIASGIYAAMADGDPNVLAVIGDDSVLVVDTTATPDMARPVIDSIRRLSSAPFRFVVLSHYHAVRTLGASAFKGASIIASRGTYDLIAERGEADYQSEFGRFPRLFRGNDSIPGITWPTIVFENELTVFVGETEVRILHLGRGHTKGDTVVWLPKEKVMFGGDTIDFRSTPYCGDGYLQEWRKTLLKTRALSPEILVPGRGPAINGTKDCQNAFDEMDEYLRDVYEITMQGSKLGSLKLAFDYAYPKLKSRYGQWFIFEHCIPFSIARAFAEAQGVIDPYIWTAERDRQLWAELHGS